MAAKVRKPINWHRRAHVERHEENWWKRPNPTGIVQQNNRYNIKEIIRHYKRLEWEAKEKYSIIKENKEFFIQLDLITKEIDLKNEALEAAKKRKERG